MSCSVVRHFHPAMTCSLPVVGNSRKHHHLYRLDPGVANEWRSSGDPVFKRTIAIDSVPPIFTRTFTTFRPKVPVFAIRQRVTFYTREITAEKISCSVEVHRFEGQMSSGLVRTRRQAINSTPASRALALSIVRVTVAKLSTVEGRELAVEARRTLLGSSSY